VSKSSSSWSWGKFSGHMIIPLCWLKIGFLANSSAYFFCSSTFCYWRALTSFCFFSLSASAFLAIWAFDCLSCFSMIEFVNFSETDSMASSPAPSSWIVLIVSLIASCLFSWVFYCWIWLTVATGWVAIGAATGYWATGAARGWAATGTFCY